jgi:uncharacterized protein (TIGR00661 family)
VARIFYSLSGEGRGHATRVRAVVEQLRMDHQVTLFTYGDAYQLLAPLYRGSSVEVHRIRGIRFRYRGASLDYPRTAVAMAGYLTGVLPSLVGYLCEHIRREKPDLVITDLEPSLPLAARRMGVPFVALNHQHVLVVNDLSALPAKLRWYGDFLGTAVRGCHSGQLKTIVSSFYAPPLKPAYRDLAVQVGVLLRPEVFMASPYSGGHLVAYLRHGVSEPALEALRGCGLPARIYGLGARPSDGPLSFHPVSTEGFLESLEGCEALVCTAGNQLVGEALYLEKPVLAIPEPGNYEQHINAHFLQAHGGGDRCSLSDLSAARLKRFLDGLPLFRSMIRPEEVNGTGRTMTALAPYLT